MKYASYPGCAAHSTARDMYESTNAVADSLDIELVEIDGWTCCGATAGHQTDHTLAVSLPGANLMMAQDMNMDVVVSCAACYNRMKYANHQITNSDEIRKRTADVLGQDYDGSVNVRHLVEVLLEDIGVERIAEKVKHSLNGLKVACYYGCLLVRPHEVTNFDDPENPTSLDRLVNAMGGEALDWPHKVECCGGVLAVTKTDVVVQLANKIIGMAKDAGADCIAVACPLCQSNLDLRQLDIKSKLGTQYDIPVLYITQLLGLCLGKSPDELGMGKLVVSPRNVLDAVGSL